MRVFDSASHVKDWVDAREYFGFSTMHLMNQGVWLVNKLLEKPSDNDTSISNLRGLVPIIAKNMGASREKLPAMSRSLTDTKRIEKCSRALSHNACRPAKPRNLPNAADSTGADPVSGSTVSSPLRASAFQWIFQFAQAFPARKRVRSSRPGINYRSPSWRYTIFDVCR